MSSDCMEQNIVAETLRGQKMYQYDYLIVGAGFIWCLLWRHELHKKGKHCLVIDRKRS